MMNVLPRPMHPAESPPIKLPKIRTSVHQKIIASNNQRIERN